MLYSLKHRRLVILTFPSYVFLNENPSISRSLLQYKAPSLCPWTCFLFGTLSFNIKNWIRWSLSNNKRFERDYMPFSTCSLARWLMEKWQSFVLLLIALLLLLVQDKWVMEWTITKVVHQCRAVVLAAGCLSCFAMHYSWLKNILWRLPRIFQPHATQLGLWQGFKKVLLKISRLMHVPLVSD